MTDKFTRKQTLMNLLYEHEEKLRMDAHDLQCARLQYKETYQMVTDIRHLLEQEIATFNED
jgi:hypothetical protein